jgi:alkanesulfonate monooxygenase SsuD/methylene tetrahydromethanopterin reductase-like flavin-dependent oxidoreductase (luciferase family)
LESKTAIFPAKFPVSGEIERRKVRSVLRRQPGILVFGQAPQEAREWAGNAGDAVIFWEPVVKSLGLKID